VVFVANGAGDARALSNHLARLAADDNLPWQIKTVDWSLGRRRVLADQTDHDNHVAQGQRLAAQVAAYRQAYPDRRVYLIGHSAGCAIVLYAAEASPPDSVDGIVLLSPSVCASYDLRQALRAARGGIDNFYSNSDRWILGLGMRMVGTTDGGCKVAAGRTGFTPAVTNSAGAALYARLHQYPWRPSVAWSGHTGNHFGNYETAFLQAYVVPLLQDR
jgi:pimeloyl-ACP methyl ester carboxylesterase